MEYSCVLFWVPQFKTDIDQWEQAQGNKTRMVDGTGDHVALRQLELGMFSLEKRWLRGGITFYKYLRGCQVEDGVDLFVVAPAGRMRTNGFK